MKEPHSTFQDISIHRRVVISIGILSVLIIVIGLYGLVAIVESNHCLHKSVMEGQIMANAIDTARLSQVHFKKQVQEWKNILLRGNNKNLYNKHLKAFNEEERKVNECLQSLSLLVSGTGMSVPQIADLIKVHEELGRQYREALGKYQQSDLKSAVLVDNNVRGIDRKLTDDIDTVVEIIKNLAEKRLKETELISKTHMEAYQALSFFLIFLMIAGVGFGVYNAMSITKDLTAEENKSSSEK